MARHRESEAVFEGQAPDKWHILRELAEAREAFGLSDRSLTVLQALLSFFPGTTLSGDRRDLVIFPSNGAICARLNGMADSTMRRHLRALVASGLIGRRDSPNGKRFVRRSFDGAEAYGFDLAPLRRRSVDIHAAAEKLRAERAAVARLRRELSLMRRDLSGLIDYGLRTGPESRLWTELASIATDTGRMLRRVLGLKELNTVCLELARALRVARTAIERLHPIGRTEEMTTRAGQSERHHQSSNIDDIESEEAHSRQAETVTVGQGASAREHVNALESDLQQEGGWREEHAPRLPLGLVLSVCEELRLLVPDAIRDWHAFVQAVALVRPMLGITAETWEEAMKVMGSDTAAVVVAAMLERLGEIRSPGGYLRHLTKRAGEGAFSCGPMVMALARRAPA